jgi:hypothetical protein
MIVLLWVNTHVKFDGNHMRQDLLEFLSTGNTDVTDVQAALDWVEAHALTPREATEVVAFLTEELEKISERHRRAFSLRTLLNSTYRVLPPSPRVMGEE